MPDETDVWKSANTHWLLKSTQVRQKHLAFKNIPFQFTPYKNLEEIQKYFVYSW